MCSSDLTWHHLSISQLLLTDDALGMGAVDIPGPGEAITQVAFMMSADGFSFLLFRWLFYADYLGFAPHNKAIHFLSFLMTFEQN